MNTKTKDKIKILISIIILICCSIGTAYYIYISNNYPKGSDVYGHLFKINELYTSICNGTFYPIYSPNWYNSIELFRYWPATSYYFYVFLMFVSGLNIYDTFIVFIAICFFIGGLSWIIIGFREKRIFLGLVIGILWFYLPDNMRIFFDEGNLPRFFINCLIPYVFFFINEIIYYKKKYAFGLLYLFLILIVSSHIMISAMLGISIFIYLLLDVIIRKEYKLHFFTLINSFLAYISSGIILIPGITGGLLSQSSEASVGVTGLWSQDLIISFNPFERFNYLGTFYFGFSILIILILGILVFHRNTSAGFISCLLIFLGTSTIASKIISHLPLSQAFWMTRFIPIATTLFFISFIKWKDLKDYLKIFFIFLIIIDCFISLKFISFDDKTYILENEETNKNYLFEEAIEISSNRIALMDLSKIESYPSMMLATNKNSKYLFGWAFQGAYNLESIVSLNESFEKGYYLYTFDRLLEYGCDTVIIRKNEVPINKFEYLDECAKIVNYKKILENDWAILYKNDINYTYGTINTYENIAIGKSSNYICYMYPCFHKADNIYLDEYSFEDLKNFKNIYLSGFEYHNLEKAEVLVKRLANNGCKIFIDMNNIPKDMVEGKDHFLDVYSQMITFTKEFPIITKNNGEQFKLKLNTTDYELWQTVYLTKLDKVLRSSEYSKDKYLDYIGTKEHENIIFMGLNLVYYCAETHHEQLSSFLDEIFKVNSQLVPNREIIGIDIKYNSNKIIINSPKNKVNTNISFLDCFSSLDVIYEENKALTIDKGETVLDISYSYFNEGLIVSIFGIILTFIFWIFIGFKLKNKGDVINEK